MILWTRSASVFSQVHTSDLQRSLVALTSPEFGTVVGSVRCPSPQDEHAQSLQNLGINVDPDDVRNTRFQIPLKVCHRFVGCAERHFAGEFCLEGHD